MGDPYAVGKRAAARAAADLVPHGCKLGLGTGSTVAHLLDRLAERKRDEGLDFVGVATSEATAARGRELGFELRDLDEVDGLDVVIDGADEVDPHFALIKGGGGAMTREKIVAWASRTMIVVVSANKIVERLGATFKLPIEVLGFGLAHTTGRVAALCGTTPLLRRGADGQPFRTDNGGLVLDAPLPAEITTGRERLHAFAAELASLPGVVEHGLFLDKAERVLVGHDDGSVSG